MLRAEFMPRSAQTALEKRECRFNGIGVSIATDIFLDSMLHHRMSEAHALRNVPVGRKFIGENDVGILADILAHELFERAARYVGGMEQSEFAIPLTDAEHGALLGTATALSVAATAYIGFIHFDLAIQHRLIHFAHCGADSVAEIPCRPIAPKSQGPLNLARGHALLRFTKQQGSHEPFRERQVRVIEDRASGDGELIVAILTVEQLLLGFEFDSGHLAAQAFRASGPAETDKQFAALFFGREHRIYIN